MGARRVLVTVAAALLAGMPAAAQADQATAGEQRAAVVAARVTRLTADYRRHSAAVAVAAADLAAAYARVDAADQLADTSGEQAARARSRRRATTLALYAYGAGARSELALLTADSPDDALWRLSVGAPLGERLLREAADRAEAAGAAATGDDAHAAAAFAATGEFATALARLREEEAAAQLALDAARAELARLDEAARQERAAWEAEAELARARDAAAAARLASGTPVTALGIPAEFERAYRDAAGTCPGLPWTLLAAVGQVESGHGRNNGPSSAGAIGPMQFMPATFASYAVDGDGDGRTDAWDPQDAVFSAARYLCASGAGGGPDGVRRALFAYNHAQWYVDLVLRTQAAITARRP